MFHADYLPSRRQVEALNAAAEQPLPVRAGTKFCRRRPAPDPIDMIIANVDNRDPVGRTRERMALEIGHAAERNSCEGPWTTALNAQIGLTGGRLHLPKTVNSVSLNLTNPLGGLDQALHGSSNLRGWGTQPFADPVLYNVRGFDPASLTTDELVKRYARSVPDPYDGIIREADSLLLTRPQLEAVQAAQKAYQEKRDAHWTKLAEYLSQLPDVYDVAHAFKRQEEASDAAWALAWGDIHESMQRIMSPVQLTLLPYPASMLWKSPEAPKGIRYIFAR